MVSPAWRIVSSVGSALIVLGASVALAAAWLPWAQFKLLGGIPVALPAMVFSSGLLVFGIALAVLFLRRTPLLCLAAAGVLFLAIQTAEVQIPRAVKTRLIGAQISIFPVNRLLDQFHIGDIEVGNYGDKDASLLGIGEQYAFDGAWLLLFGSLLSLPRDPLVMRLIRVRCRSCGASWKLYRMARFCPACGVAADPRACPRCGEIRAAGDRFCAVCGAPFAVS